MAARLGGGGARSALWREIQAMIYGRTVEIVQAEEGAALGAAILAGVGGGVWPTVDTACGDVVRIAQQVTPKPEDVSAMNDRYGVYTRVYPALKTIVDS